MKQTAVRGAVSNWSYDWSLPIDGATQYTQFHIIDADLKMQQQRQIFDAHFRSDLSWTIFFLSAFDVYIY